VISSDWDQDFILESKINGSTHSFVKTGMARDGHGAILGKR
jgi:hypothetical protein